MPARDVAGEKQYIALRDTFDAFDKDRSDELGYSEFLESWTFLNRSGTENEIKQAFDGVDIDKSGLVKFSEYEFALIGKSKVTIFTEFFEMKISKFIVFPIISIKAPKVYPNVLQILIWMLMSNLC